MSSSKENFEIPKRGGESKALRESILLQLGMDQSLRAVAMEHLWTHDMVDTYGSLSSKGRLQLPWIVNQNLHNYSGMEMDLLRFWKQSLCSQS